MKKDTGYARYLLGKRKREKLTVPEANWLANWQRKQLRIVKMNWQPISEYKCANYARGEDVILFDAVEGVKPGRGNRHCYDEDPNDPDHTYIQHRTYGCCGHTLKNVTHFMAMPTPPQKKEVALAEDIGGLTNELTKVLTEPHR